jgi:hypothetical protein
MTLDMLDPAGRTDIASHLAEEPYCVSPVIGACVGLVADMLTIEERGELRRVLPSTIGTNTTTADDDRRADMMLDFAMQWQATVRAGAEPADECVGNAFRAWDDTHRLVLEHCHDDHCHALTAAWGAFLRVIARTRGAEGRAARELCHDALIATGPFDLIEQMCTLDRLRA